MPGYLFLYLQEHILLMKEKKLNFREKKPLRLNLVKTLRVFVSTPSFLDTLY